MRGVKGQHVLHQIAGYEFFALEQRALRIRHQRIGRLLHQLQRLRVVRGVVEHGAQDFHGVAARGCDYVFLGQQLMQSSKVSAETAAKIEKEVKALVEGGLEEARRILTEKNDDWETLSQGLLEYETLTGEEIKNLLAGKKPERPEDPPEAPSGTPPTGAVPTVDEDEEEDSSLPGGLEPKPGGA